MRFVIINSRVLPKLKNLFELPLKSIDVGGAVVKWLVCLTRNLKVASSNPGRPLCCAARCQVFTYIC